MRLRTTLVRPAERRLAAEVLGALGLILALLARVEGLSGLVTAGLALLVAATLLLVVQAPAGSVPLGYALVIALAVLRNPSGYFAVLGLAVLATVPVLVARQGAADAGRRILGWLVAGSTSGALAILARTVVTGASPSRTLIHIVVAGVGFLAADFLMRRLVPSQSAAPMRIRESWPVYVSLLCAAGLIAVGYQRGGEWMALVALIPLVLTRFAFDRYAAAREAYQQTIRALSIVPEVAGVAPLGHGERSATYAVALGRKLGLTGGALERVAAAARLHHIGYVTVDDPMDVAYSANRRLLARLGGDILRQTEFLADVGDLVESVHEEGGELVTREAAVVRVATTFDHLVLEQPERAQGAIELLAFQQCDPYGAAAVLALRWLLAEDADLLERAVASGAPMTEAAGSNRVAYG